MIMMVCVGFFRGPHHKKLSAFHYVAGEVQVATSSITITEGANATVCVILTATSGSPTSLANLLVVDLTTNLNAEAGLTFLLIRKTPF